MILNGALPTRSTSHDEAFADIMRPYIQAPAQFTEVTYDVVLIDGRYRTACAWAVLPYLKETSVVLCTIGRDRARATRGRRVVSVRQDGEVDARAAK